MNDALSDQAGKNLLSHVFAKPLFVLLKHERSLRGITWR